MNHRFLAFLIAIIALYPTTANTAQDANITMAPTANSQDPPQKSTIQDLNREKDLLQNSFDRWNTTYIIALILTVLVVVLAGLSQFQTINRSKSLVAVQSKIERESDRLLRAELTDKDVKIAELNKISGELNKTASEALERAGNAESHLADANTKAIEATARAKQAEAEVAKANAASHEAVAKVAEADARSAEASAKAESFRLDIAKANTATERERLARVQLEMQLAQMFAPRVLTPSQKEQIASILRSRSTRTIDVVVFGDTPEINAFSGSLIDAIGAVWPMNLNHPMGGGMAVTGVLIGVKDGSPPDVSEAAKLIVSALKQTLGNGVGLWDFEKMQVGGVGTGGQVGTPGPEPAPIRIFIGSKQ